MVIINNLINNYKRGIGNGENGINFHCKQIRKTNCNRKRKTAETIKVQANGTD